MGILGRVFSIHNYMDNLKDGVSRYLCYRADSLASYFNGISSRSFDNGLSAKIREHSGLRTLSVQVKVGAGHAMNATDKPGLAHFVEHMAFNKSPEMIKRVQNDFQARGGSYGAITGPHQTIFSFNIPYSEENAQFLSRMIEEIVFTPPADPQQVEYEKTVVKSEMNAKMDERTTIATAAMADAAMKSIFGENDRLLNALGTPESLAGFTVQDMQEFHARYYVPNNIQIEVAAPPGATSLVFSEFKERFSSLAPCAVPALEPPALKFAGGPVHLDQFDLKQAYYNLLFMLPQLSGSRDAASHDVLVSYLNLASFSEMRGMEDRKNYYNEWRGLDHEGFKFMLFMGSIDSENAGAVLPMVARIMGDLAEGRVDEEILAAARSRVGASMLDTKFEERSTRFSFTGPFTSSLNARNIQKNTAGVTAEDLQDLARDMLYVPPLLITAGPVAAMQTYAEFRNMLPDTSDDLFGGGADADDTPRIVLLHPS